MSYKCWDMIDYLDMMFREFEKKPKLPNLLNANNLAIKDVKFSPPATIVFLV